MLLHIEVLLARGLNLLQKSRMRIKKKDYHDKQSDYEIYGDFFLMKMRSTRKISYEKRLVFNLLKTIGIR